MNRSDLFALAKAHGWKSGKPLTKPRADAIAAAIHASLTAEVLAGARIHDTYPRQMTADEAVAALMEEL